MPPLSVTGGTALVSGILCVLLVAVVAIIAKWVKKSDPTRAKDAWLLLAPLLWLVLAVLAGIIAIYSVILYFAFGAYDFQLPTSANTASPVLVAATLVAGALTAAYAVLRLRAHLLAEARSRLDAHGDERADERHQHDREVAYSERFAKAVELLAIGQPISRIAGAHLVLSLGDEWTGGAQKCLDVVISHLRGLREKFSDEDERDSHGVREEVRLITSEVIERLSSDGHRWDVRAGDFSGTVLDSVNLANLVLVDNLDFSGALVFGGLAIPEGATRNSPRLSNVEVRGDLSVAWSEAWEGLDISEAKVVGSVDISGRRLRGRFGATSLVVEQGGLTLGFEEFQDDMELDSMSVDGVVRLGLSGIGASFGTEDIPVSVSFLASKFGRLELRRLTRGPRLELGGAGGAIDLSGSVFPFEVGAANLDARDGLNLRGARFDSALVLEGAEIPKSIDTDGLELSVDARNAIQSSEFVFKEQLLAVGAENSPSASAPVDPEQPFEWRKVLDSLKDEISNDFTSELEGRLERLAQALPLDWPRRGSFVAQLNNVISRAAATTDTSDLEEKVAQKAFARLVDEARKGARAS